MERRCPLLTSQSRSHAVFGFRLPARPHEPLLQTYMGQPRHVAYRRSNSLHALAHGANSCSWCSVLQNKTEFSQDKYKRRKAKKYLTYLTVRQPTARVVCEVVRIWGLTPHDLNAGVRDSGPWDSVPGRTYLASPRAGMRRRCGTASHQACPRAAQMPTTGPRPMCLAGLLRQVHGARVEPAARQPGGHAVAGQRHCRGKGTCAKSAPELVSLVRGQGA